jgi:hypothetical protein
MLPLLPLLLPLESLPLLSEQSPDPLEHAVLLGVVWVVFRRNLEERRESGGVCLNAMPYPFSDLRSIRTEPPDN